MLKLNSSKASSGKEPGLRTAPINSQLIRSEDKIADPLILFQFNYHTSSSFGKMLSIVSLTSSSQAILWSRELVTTTL